MKKIIIFIFLSFIFLLVLLGVTLNYSRSWENGYIMKPLYQIDNNEKVIALTFDDGPSKERTPKLLNLLEKYDVKATFFMLGENIEKYPFVAKEVYDKGHLIGNHSYNHPRLIFKTFKFIENQINKTDILIKSIGQNEVKYMRPPYSSKYLLLPYILKRQGKILVTGTYDPPSEYLKPYNGEKVANEVIRNIKSGSIIYLHDGKKSDVEEFLKSVELIIQRARDKGYRFVLLSD